MTKLAMDGRKTASKNGPKCPACGSANLIVGGFVSFHWREGRLVPQLGTEEIADGAPWNCQGCGQTWSGAYEAPFNLQPDR